MQYRLGHLACVWLVAVAAVGPGVAAATVDPGAPTQTSGELRVTQTLALTPDRPGEVGATISFDVPDNVGDLEPTIRAEHTLVETRGFSRTGDGAFAWDGSTPAPSITVRYPANETGAGLGPEGDAGSLLFADVGEWAIVRDLPVAVSYTYRGEISVRRSLAVAGEGVAGDTMAYLGPHTTAVGAADGQRLRLVVPSAARLQPERSDVLATVAEAADAIRVGDRDPTVTMIAAPTTVDWAVRGLQVGDADFFAAADQPLDVPDNTWLHEYVHTRQNLSLAPSTRWLTEGMATYYAAQLALAQERIDFDAFRDFLARGGERRFRDVALADPGTWTGSAHYWKGALVAGRTDRAIRAVTERRASLQGVWAWLNGRDAVDQAALLDRVARLSRPEVADQLRADTGRGTPAMWDRAAHAAAFGTAPARVVTGLPARDNASAWTATGPFGDRSLAPTPEATLVDGESLRVALPVTNAGGTTGGYELRVTLDDHVVAERSGEVGPGETVWEPVTVGPAALGTHTLAVGADALTIRVREPADLTVADLRANRTALSGPGWVRVTATVRNDADRPGQRSLAVLVDDDVRERVSVRMAAGDATTVSTALRLADGGDHRINVGDAAVTVRVTGTSGPLTDGTTATTGAGGDGFGVGVAVLAMALIALRLRA